MNILQQSIAGSVRQRNPSSSLTFLPFDPVATSPVILDLPDNSDTLPVLLRPVRLAPPVPQRHCHLGHLLPCLDKLFKGRAPLCATSLPSQSHHDTSQYRTFPTCSVR